MHMVENTLHIGLSFACFEAIFEGMPKEKRTSGMRCLLAWSKMLHSRRCFA
jgi:hypothetical protein